MNNWHATSRLAKMMGRFSALRFNTLPQHDDGPLSRSHVAFGPWMSIIGRLLISFKKMSLATDWVKCLRGFLDRQISH